MLGAQSGSLHFARRPIKPPSHAQPFLPGHGAKEFHLFRTGLFIRQHEITMRRRGHSRKQKAFLAPMAHKD
jgi:hypothetical protein